MKKSTEKPVDRRRLIVGGAVVAAGIVAAPHVANAQAGATTTWKVQTSWPAGVGLETFKKWCATIKEKTADWKDLFFPEIYDLPGS